MPTTAIPAPDEIIMAEIRDFPPHNATIAVSLSSGVAHLSLPSGLTAADAKRLSALIAAAVAPRVRKRRAKP